MNPDEREVKWQGNMGLGLRNQSVILGYGGERVIPRKVITAAMATGSTRTHD